PHFAQVSAPGGASAAIQSAEFRRRIVSERPLTITRPRTRPLAAQRSAAVFTAEEKRKIFRGMVVGELEAGFLRYSRRQALLNYAARLGIPEFEANLLIAEAQYNAGDIEPIGLES